MSDAAKHRPPSEKQLAVLRAHGWQPGQSGNPAGRKRSAPSVAECLNTVLALRYVKGDTGIEGWDRAVLIATKVTGRKPASLRQLLADMMVIGGVMAAAKGNTGAASDIRDTTDGKPTTQVELSGPGGAPITVAEVLYGQRQK